MPLDALHLQLHLDGVPADLLALLQEDWPLHTRVPTTRHLQVRPLPEPFDARGFQQVVQPGTRLFCQERGGQLLLAAADAWLELDFTQNTLRFHGEAAALKSLFQLAISEMLRQEGCVPVHGAALLQHGKATLLLGPSGMGKSTTLLRAARQNIPALAEDRSWITPDLHLHGWERHLHLMPDTVAPFQDVLPHQGHPVRRGGRTKLAFALSDLPWFERVALPVGQLWVLERHPPTRLEQPARLELVKALWEATGVALSRKGQQQSEHWVQRLLKLPARKLLLGPEVDFSSLEDHVH